MVDGATAEPNSMVGLILVVVVSMAMNVDGVGVDPGDVGEIGAEVGLLSGELVGRPVGGLVGAGEIVGANVGGGG